MTVHAFDTAIEETDDRLVGPWRQPRQMLHAQTYESHASIHDDATAQKLGFKGGTIEGPTHFSQFAPLCEWLWGREWFETGCISAHYRNASETVVRKQDESCGRYVPALNSVGVDAMKSNDDNRSLNVAADHLHRRGTRRDGRIRMQ